MRSWTITGLLLIAAAAAPALAAEPHELETITIRIYDYANVEDAVLAAAQREAGGILARAGLATRWERCDPERTAGRNDASCSRRAGEALIQLRIHSRRMTKKIARNGIEFGYALASPEGYGVIAGVYFDRTNDLARQLGESLPLMLGHTMAHEIGHLLLGSNSHAKTGIMRPTWGERELHLAHVGAFGFTPAQAKRMKRKASERIALDAARSSDGAERTLAQLFGPAD